MERVYEKTSFSGTIDFAEENINFENKINNLQLPSSSWV